MNFFNSFLDIVYPRKCIVCHKKAKASKEGSYICGRCREKINYVKMPICMKCGKPLSDFDREYCTNCQNINYYFDKGISLCVYDDVMSKSIHRFKDGGNYIYAESYALEMFRYLGNFYKSWNIDYIIPVPLSKKKKNIRGFNQAEKIADSLGELLNVEVLKNILIKVNNNTPQKNLNFYERKKNIKNAFILKENIVQSKVIMLVDDVFTTGSTIDAAAHILKDHGAAKVYFTTVCTGKD